MGDSVTTVCPQAWHGGLSAGVLVECTLPVGHRGWHRNAKRTMSWGGKLTPEEVVIAETLRNV